MALGARLAAFGIVPRRSVAHYIRERLCNDLDAATTAQMIAGGMHPEPPALFFERASRAGLPQIPATYVQLEHDRALAPAAQVQQARNANARLVSLPSGHTVMLSRPEALAQLLGELTARDGV